MMQGVCADPPSLYLCAIWSAQRASDALIAGAPVPAHGLFLNLSWRAWEKSSGVPNLVLDATRRPYPLAHHAPVELITPLARQLRSVPSALITQMVSSSAVKAIFWPSGDQMGPPSFSPGSYPVSVRRVRPVPSAFIT